MSFVSTIGFDGHSANVSLLNKKILKNPGDLFISNEKSPGSKIFPFFDTSHLFKNFYNNWMAKGTFQCPLMDEEQMNKTIHPSFSHLRELYDIEKGRPEKLAYKLTEKVLHPQVMEKTNVKLADSAFHESTINALNYYSLHGYSHFHDSALFAKTIRDWFNTLNVMCLDYGKRKREERRYAIRRESVEEDLSYIARFVNWLELWNSKNTSGLSKATFQAAIRSSKAVISLVHYLFERYENLEFILLGNILSDFLEGRFGWWRQMCGGNYYNSVIKFLQSEKTIRLRSRWDMT